MTTIRFDDPRDDLAYPFLPAEWQWEIISRPLAGEEALTRIFAAATPTLRWVKDNKVLDLVVPGQDTATFLGRSGLRLSLAKGGYVLSKRLARIMRPFRFWGFFGADEVTVDYNPRLDPALWDGCGQISRTLVERLAARLSLDDRQRRELLSTERFEVTTLHAAGQDKGHVLVVDDLAVDLMFPAGSAKTELALVDGRVFVGLHPVHSADEMCLDVQSIINLHPFFRPEQLLAWTQLESGLFLESLRSGQLAAVLNRLYDADSAADLESLSSWHVGAFAASGGDVMWFAGLVRAVGRQHLKRLGSRAGKLRCPAPGGRYYLFPAAVGDRQVPPGQVELDPATATAWVNDDDWLATIVPVLGGCDGDDAVWVLPFADGSDGNRRKLLLWRSPNQVGEYVLLEPTARCHTIAWEIPAGTLTYPHMQSRLLPARIDSWNYQYGVLSEASDPDFSTKEAYSIGALASTIRRAAANRGVLGAHCNALMLCKALYGRLPQALPAPLEAVIDGTVKTGLDLAPVKAWNAMALRRMVAHGQVNPSRALPAALVDRLPPWLAAQARVADRHWLDTLAAALETHRAQYRAEVEALATEACPPLAVFEHGREWLAVGKDLCRAYSRAFRQVLATVEADDPEVDEVDEALLEAAFAAARDASAAFLAQWPAETQPYVLLGAAAALYAQGPRNGQPVRDGVLWQLGEPRTGETGRLPGIAQQMLQALRQIGVLGEPVWTVAGPVLHYRNPDCPRRAGVPVKLNGTWFNFLNATTNRRYHRMSEVPPPVRAQAKARIADYVQEQFRGLLLTTEVTDTERVITRTPHGNLFGYVQRDHELQAVRYDRWRIAWATAVDGNVMAILEPAVAEAAAT